MQKNQRKRILDPVKHFNSWMRNVLRKIFFQWRGRTEALQQARVGRGQYRCAGCLEIFPPKEIRVDHFNPVVDPKEGFVDWDVYIERLFCEGKNLQILCKPCHHLKTQAELEERRSYRTGIFSDKAREQMSQIRKGHHDNLGIKKSEEAKKNMSIERKGKPQTPARIEAAKRSAKLRECPVIGIFIETGEEKEFASVTKAAEALKFHPSNVSQACKGSNGRTQTHGWKFQYKAQKNLA